MDASTLRRCALLPIMMILMGLNACSSPVANTPLTPSALRDAADYSASRRGISLLVLHHGKTLLEEYPNGGSKQTTHQIYSGTKTFFTMATLAAAQDGLLKLDDRVSDTITEWRSDSQKNKITIRELMNFTDGLDPAFTLHSDKLADRNTLALQTKVVAKTGAAFTYGPSHGQVLCELLRRKIASSGKTPFEYVQKKVINPLGIGTVEHKEDSKSNPLVASGFRLTARQWSKFGLMIAERSKNAPDDLFSQCFRGTRVNPMFGLGFWLNKQAGESGVSECDIENTLDKKWQSQNWQHCCICRNAPPDLVAAVGSYNQRLFVIPSLDLVIVRQGENASFSDAEFLRRILNR
jgi:CubicO group peptidase (beta-lactamase class C family)